MVELSAAAVAPPAQHYAALDGVRGFAVLLIFLVHASGIAAFIFLGIHFDETNFAALSTPGEKLLYWLYSSHHGVFLFFVLSGFLIGTLWWPEAKFGYGQFAMRRVLRIYPAFLLNFVAAVGVALLFGNWHPPETGHVLANLFFANGLPSLQVAPFNPVTWSLFFEMVFYLVFPLLIFAARPLGSAARWAIPGLGVLAPAMAVALGADPIHLCWSLLFMGVAFGMNPKALESFAATVPSVAMVVLYLVVTTASALSFVQSDFSPLLFGAVATPLIASSLYRQGILARIFCSPPLVALGRISYSFYLWHWIVLTLLAWMLKIHGSALEPVGRVIALFVVGFLASTLVSAGSWWLAERPYFIWAKARAGRQPRRNFGVR